MHEAVVRAVRELAGEKRSRFRATSVADRAGVSVDVARRDLMDLAKIGDLTLNFEVMSPESGETLATFGQRDEIPPRLEDREGREHEVTRDLIWVSFSPTERVAITQPALESQVPRVPGKADRPARAGRRPIRFRSMAAPRS